MLFGRRTFFLHSGSAACDLAAAKVLILRFQPADPTGWRRVAGLLASGEEEKDFCEFLVVS
jgi:hypothetical protein